MDENAQNETVNSLSIQLSLKIINSIILLKCSVSAIAKDSLNKVLKIYVKLIRYNWYYFYDTVLYFNYRAEPRKIRSLILFLTSGNTLRKNTVVNQIFQWQRKTILAPNI